MPVVFTAEDLRTRIVVDGDDALVRAKAGVILADYGEDAEVVQAIRDAIDGKEGTAGGGAFGTFRYRRDDA